MSLRNIIRAVLSLARLALAAVLAGAALARGHGLASLAVAVLEVGIFVGLPRSVLGLAVAATRIQDGD